MSTPSTSSPQMIERFRSWWWTIAGCGILGLVILAGIRIRSAGPRLSELQVDVFLKQHRTNFIDHVAVAIHYGLEPTNGVILAVLITLVLMRVQTVKDGAAFAALVTVAWLIWTSVKYVVERPRPPARSVMPLVSELGLTSFPSGHTAFAAALVAGFALIVARGKKATYWTLSIGFCFVLLVAFSRVYLGVHYPSDVTAGIALVFVAVMIWLPIWNNLLAPRFGARGAQVTS